MSVNNDCRLKNTVKALTEVIILVILMCHSISAQYSRTIHDGYTPTGVEQGGVAGSYPLSGFESVNLFNGNLNVAFPLLKVGGRGTAGYTMMLQADMHWEIYRLSENLGGINVTEDAQFRAGRSWRVGYGPGFLIGLWAADKTPTPQGGVVCDGSVPYYRVNYLTRLSFIMPDGAEVMLHDKLYQGSPYELNWCDPSPASRNRGKVFVSDDGESTTFISDSDIFDNINANLSFEFKPSGFLLIKDGTRYRIDNGKVSWIRDRNGNKLSFTYETLDSGASWRMLTATDSLNRVVSISYGTTSVSFDQINFSGFGGNQRNIKVWYSPIQNILIPGATIKKAKQLFPEIYNSANLGTGEWDHNPALISKIELPDQRTYQFFYNSYGEVARIILPTGGGFDYEYSPSVYHINDTYDNVYNLMIYRRVTKRTIFNSLTAATDPVNPPPGIREKMENYVVDPPHGYVVNPAGGTIIRVDVLDGNNSLTGQSRHYFYGKPYESENLEAPPIAYSWWPSGKEYKTESYNVSGGISGAMLAKSEQNWSPTITLLDPVGWVGAPAPNPVLAESVSTLSETNQVTKQTFGYDQYNNQIDTWEYDYGLSLPGVLIRHTHTNYLTNGYDTIAGGVNNPDPATTIHIRNLPHEQFVYDGNGALKAQTTYEYDTNTLGNLVDRVDITGLISRNNLSPGSGYVPTIDMMRGNLTEVKRWLLSLDGQGTAAQITSLSQYDIAGNVVKVRDANGKDTTFSFADSFAGSFTPNTYAFLTSTTSPVPAMPYGGGQALVSSSMYDFSSGKIVSTQDPNLKTTSFEYTDNLDRLTKVIRPNGGGVTRYTYCDGTEVASLCSAGELSLLTGTLQSGSELSGTWLNDRVVYDGLGRAKRSAHYEGTAGWSVRETQFDALGRVSQVSNPFFASDYSGGAGSAWTTTTYDALGRVTRITTPDLAHVDTSYVGSKVTVTDQAGKTRSSVTDGVGRLIQVNEDPNGTPGNSPLNYQTNYTYDALGNLIRVRQGGFPTGNSPDPTVQFRRFYYDSLSRLVYANNPEQNATIAFNPLGESGTMWTMKYEYDPNGNLTKRTDARAIVTNYGYDALNRNTTVDYSDTLTISQDIQRYYDTATNGKGRLQKTVTNLLNSTGTTRIDSQTIINSYDNLGRVTSQSQGFKKSDGNWQNFTVLRNNNSYDLAGHVTYQSNPSGSYEYFQYNAGGRSLQSWGTLGADSGETFYSSGTQYNAAGQLIQEVLGQFTYHRMDYNKRFQMTEVRVSTNPGDPASWDLGKLRFFYNSNAKINENPALDGPDNNGNVLRQEHWVPTIVTSVVQGGYTVKAVSQYAVPMRDDYFYDPINRITQVQGWQRATGTATPAPIYQQSYSYDKFGNRKLDANQTWGSGINGANTTSDNLYDIDKLTNRLAGATYDSAGNLRADPGVSLKTQDRTYDAENRMTSAKMGGTTSYYVYDGDGRRVRRLLSTGEFWQVYGIDGELLAEYQWNGSTASLKKEYGYRDGQLLVVAEPANGQTPPQVKWLIADHLGTPRMVLDKTGSLSGVTRHDYLPFGEELMVGMGNGSIRSMGIGYVTDLVRQKFGAKEWDSETGLSYFLFRHYNTVQGRFLSIDPENAGVSHEYPQSWNGYAYSLNSPINLSDPDGSKTLVCTPDGKECFSHSDKDFQNAKEAGKENGYVFTRNEGFMWSGAIYDSGGNLIATYTQVSIDDNSANLTHEMQKAFSNPETIKKAVTNTIVGAMISGAGPSRQGASSSSSGWDLGKLIGTLRESAKKKGNFGMGRASRMEAKVMGEAWVGPGYRVASDGKTLISADGLRQYRPPSNKPRLGKEQANFEWRTTPNGPWTGNGHLDIQ